MTTLAPETSVAAVHDRPADRSVVRIRRLDSSSASRWDMFVERCADATFFHRAGWKTVIERAFGHRAYFLYAEADGRIEGVLPLAEIRSLLFGHTLSALPFCVYGGTAATTERARAALDEAACALAQELKVNHLEYRSRAPRHADWLHKDLYCTFRKPITADADRNLLDVPRKQRAMVRKGIKAGLASEIDADVDRFYEAYAASVHRLGTPVFSRRYFQVLKQVFEGDCEVLTINLGGRLVAGVLSFYFRDEVLPYYGGGTTLAREVAGNDFMYWEVMRRATERGVRLFDYGRSKRGTGSFDFKRNWGFEPEPLHYEYLLVRGRRVPDHNPLNPKYAHFIRLWQRLPRPVADCIGPHIVKRIG